jgi:hypothetical protein
MALSDAILVACRRDRTGDEDGALDLIWEHFDGALNASRFSAVDAALQDCDVSATTTDVLVALLAVTGHAADRLQEYARFQVHVTKELDVRGVPRADLGGLVSPCPECSNTYWIERQEQDGSVTGFPCRQCDPKAYENDITYPNG